MTGTLYVVATPIGNLGDLSSRAAHILGEVTLVASEDTRSARRLLEHCHLHTPAMSYHDHNEDSRIPEIVARLNHGENVALISDAGLPTISDPGFRLVRACLEGDIRVVGIPGPCAAVTALSISGLPTDRFLFLGFSPARSSRRRSVLQEVAQEPGTLIFYESPHRVLETLNDIGLILPGRRVVLARELTKIHEEVVSGTTDTLVSHLEANHGERLRGEMTLLIEGSSRQAPEVASSLALAEGMGVKEVAAEVARVLGLSRRDVYQALCRLSEKERSAQSGKGAGSD